MHRESGQRLTAAPANRELLLSPANNDSEMRKSSTIASHMSVCSVGVETTYRPSKSRSNQTNRTTIMLLVVVFTVFLAECPIALLLLLR